MKATGVDVHIGWFGYEGSLIDEVYRDKETREYVFRVNLKLRTLFEPDQFTQVDWAVRRQLGGQPLAQWLHGFYASHGLNRFRRPRALGEKTSELHRALTFRSWPHRFPRHRVIRIGS